MDDVPVSDSMLDPIRTHGDEKQTALVLISSVLRVSSAEQPASFMVDSVQFLQPAEVDAVKVCLKRLRFLTTLAGHMKHEASPVKASSHCGTRAGVSRKRRRCPPKQC